MALCSLSEVQDKLERAFCSKLKTKREVATAGYEETLDHFSEQTEEAIKGLQGSQRELGLSRLSKSIPRFDLLDSEQASESEYGCTELVHSSHRLQAFICG